MSETTGVGETEGERRASHALQAYRERRRQRRGEDTYFGSGDCLLGPAAAGGEPEPVRRRSELVEEAQEIGMPATLAEKLYEVAIEEGLEPGLGFELVRCGLGVRPPDEGVVNASIEPTSEKYLPEWMFPPIPADDLLRERTLRMSFRRLGSLLESQPEANEALRAFAREPDVGPVGY